MKNDLIRRQDAIEALSNGALINYQAAGHNNGLVKAIDVIKGLPSAQPEISPCDVCRYNPPSSADGKPCTMCPAERRTDG